MLIASYYHVLLVAGPVGLASFLHPRVDKRTQISSTNRRWFYNVWSDKRIN